ncbi:MAG: isoprenylcysteine carboxylmethyltransferase family protein [Bradyrhizobium sp.]|uniref:methyltransferase family protein n=1 Tax=Bradyrhizobium sp. TaxID=376 RepID=UPI0023959851|nr:isoprenylcysteine carboxylmethyltransferase family protein [Bradyrhizobium sp.]MDE2602640.1 isoprenylcysteine carboxylmethyltransferase family protein [Bradyrhizobium sp.]
MIPKWAFQSAIWIVAMGTLLFVPAGTWRWPAAWIFLAAMTLTGLFAGLWLAKTDPELLAERMRLTARDGQPAADKLFVPILLVVFLGWFVLIGIDHRLHGSELPLAFQIIGLAMQLVATAFIMWVMRVNSFAAPLVKVQSERGHHVIDSGPYAWVRHPMYTGIIVFFIGIPLLLGSPWGLIASPSLAFMFVIRITIEERTLILGLEGYADYTLQVRYRLLPGVW